MAATWEIGDVLPLAWTITVAGVPTNATVTVTVTKPDGTSSSPAVTNPATGSYAANYTPTVNGQHIFRWVATGAVTAAESGSFVVGGIISLAQAKATLRKSSTADDVQIQEYIDALTGPMEAYCGPIIARSVTEWPESEGSAVLMLDQTPIISVTSLTEYRGNVAYPYTEITDPTSGGLYTFIVDPTLDGKVTRVFNGGRNLPFTGPVKAVYQVGLAVIPPNYTLAGKLLVQALWRTQNGGAGLPALPDEAAQQDLIIETIRSPRIQMLLGPPNHALGIA